MPGSSGRSRPRKSPKYSKKPGNAPSSHWRAACPCAAAIQAISSGGVRAASNGATALERLHPDPDVLDLIVVRESVVRARDLEANLLFSLRQTHVAGVHEGRLQLDPLQAATHLERPALVE